MNNDILYISQGKLNFKPQEDDKVTHESEYLLRYKNSLRQIKQKQDWKNSGSSAIFQGTYMPKVEPSTVRSRLSCVCPFDENGYIYSAETDSTSGIFYKFFDKGNENHIIHSNREIFGGLDYNSAAKKIVAGVSGAAAGRQDIAVFEVDENNLKQITQGDSADENPSFSKRDGKILYNSRGIGRDANMNMVRYSESSIFAIDERGGVSELLTEKGFDLIAPKDDAKGNLYYIKKPYAKPKQRGTGHLLLDLLLLPFWLLYGIVYFLMFLARVAKTKTNKSSDKSASENPYVTPKQSEREIFIHQEMIDIQGEERRNIKSGDKTAGFAPKSFELWMMDISGTKIKLKDKVLDFDVCKDGQIIYTNGKYIFAFNANIATNESKSENQNKNDSRNQKNNKNKNNDTILIKDTLITKIKFNCTNENPAHKPYSPF